MATIFTTYDAASGGATIAASSGGNYAGSPVQTVLTGVFDASKRALAAADEAELITIPAGTHVTHVFVEVITTDDSGHIFSIGNRTTANGFAVSVPADATGVTQGAGADVAATTLGIYYAAEDAVSILALTGDPLDTLKIKVSVVCTIL